jgi:hypothetical protein
MQGAEINEKRQEKQEDKKNLVVATTSHNAILTI